MNENIYIIKISDIKYYQISEMHFFDEELIKSTIGKFAKEKDRVRTLVGKILVEKLASKVLDLSDKKLVIEKNEYGKPYIKDYPEFNFNISHSGDYVACAIDKSQIGIDVEEVIDIDYKEIAKTFFAKGEYEYITEYDSNVALSRFYEIWTLKESYVKSTGKGLSIPLNSFEIQIDTIGNVKIISEDAQKKYSFKKFDIGVGYKLGVCSLNENLANNIIMLEPNWLLD